MAAEMRFVTGASFRLKNFYYTKIKEKKLKAQRERESEKGITRTFNSRKRCIRRRNVAEVKQMS